MEGRWWRRVSIKCKWYKGWGHTPCPASRLPPYQECEDLVARGISGTGAGFDAPAAGKACGGFVGRAGDVPAHRLRELAVQAAEARLRRRAVMPQGPHTAGG